MNGTEHAEEATLDRLVVELKATGERLDVDLRARWMAKGEAAAPSLIAVLQDESAAAVDAPGEGWPVIHAVDLLVDLRAPAAIRPLLEVARAGELDDVLSTRVMVRLPEYGALALDPVLEVLAATSERDWRVALCEVLSQLGVRDPQIWRSLVANFELSPGLFASFLARYGDPRGAALIERALYQFQPSANDASDLRDLEDMLEAHGNLGGEVSHELSKTVEALLEMIRPSPVVTSTPQAKVGRNDPCPCGSGKKSKRCCSP